MAARQPKKANTANKQTNKQKRPNKKGKQQTKTMITRTPGTAPFTSPVSKLYGIALL